MGRHKKSEQTIEEMMNKAEEKFVPYIEWPKRTEKELCEYITPEQAGKTVSKQPLFKKDEYIEFANEWVDVTKALRHSGKDLSKIKITCVQ